MRGRRTFRKFIDKTPSGNYRWRIVDFYGNPVASGQEHRLEDARRNSRETERREWKNYQTR